MHTKTFRILLVLVAGIVFLIGAYYAGYERGHSVATRGEAKFGIVLFPALVKMAEAGDVATLRDKLRSLVFVYTSYYDKHFSHEPDTDPIFLGHLTLARAIARSVDQGGVIATNRGPDTALQPTP